MEAQHDLKRAKPRTLTESIEIATLFDEMHPVNRQANHVNATNGNTNPTKKKKNRNSNQVANNVNHNQMVITIDQTTTIAIIDAGMDPIRIVVILIIIAIILIIII
jgi:hypothetical protein